MGDFSKWILEKLAPTRVQLVTVVFLAAGVIRYGHRFIDWFDRMPQQWEWVGSGVTVLSGTLLTLWFIAWLWSAARKFWTVAWAKREGLTEAHFRNDELVILMEFANHAGKELDPDVTRLGVGYLTPLEVCHTLEKMEKDGLLTRATAGGYTLSDEGQKRALLMLTLYRENKDWLKRC